METRANYVAVGIFTLVAVLAAFAFVYWSAGIGERGETATLRIRIPGSAAGLARGSVVSFNGVRVGDVRRVYIDPTDPSAAIADAEIDRLTPLTRSTQAAIGLAGLTGTANVEMNGASTTEANLLDEAEANGTVAEIVAKPSPVTNLLQTAQDIFQRADNVVGQMEGFVQEVRGPLQDTIGNIRTFSDALASNAPGVERFLASVSSLSEELSGFSGKLDGTLRAAEDLLRSVDPQKIDRILANAENFTNNLDRAGDRFDTVIDGVNQTVASVGTFTDDARKTLARVDTIVAAVDVETLKTAMTNIEEVTASARRSADDIAKVTSGIGERSQDIDRIITEAGQIAERFNKAADDIAKVTGEIGGKQQDIGQIITDAREFTGRLNAASARIDGVLAKLDGLLGSDEAEGIMAEANATLKSFRQVADTLNARMGTITDGLARFSGQGLREVEALVRDGRRSINRIEQAITDLERNPQRIITGGAGTVREYDGRARR